MDENKMVKEEETEVLERRAGGFSEMLNRYFHHLDRGGSLGGEITAGLILFFLSICVLFVNMQILAGAINGEVTLVSSPANSTNIAAASTYAQIYAGSILVALVGTLVIGLIARLPFTQMSTMGLASSLLCLVGTETGLTYENLLFINLLAAVIYAVLAGVPMLRELVYKALPQPVRKGLPVAVGLMFAYAALQVSGIVSTEKIAIGTSGGQYITTVTGITALSDGRKLTLYAMIGAAVAIIAYILFRVIKRKHAVMLSLLTGTIIFFALDAVLAGVDTANTESILNFGRIWMAAGSQASPQTPFADSYLTYCPAAIGYIFSNLGNVIVKGCDFSAYSGNTILLLVNGVLCYVLVGIYDAEGTLLAAEEMLNAEANETGRVDFSSQKGIRKALLCNAGINILAPFFGVGGVTIGKTSLAAVQDRGKSGIVSVVAAIGYLISLFIMAFPVLFATTTYGVGSMNQWNYFAYGNGGFVYLMQAASFAIADVVMICVGTATLTGVKKWNWKDITEWIPAVLTVGCTVLFMNLAAGVVCGTVIALILKLVFGKKKTAGEKE